MLRIAAFGELLWDRLPQGAELGGAPANFAANLAGGAALPERQVLLISRVGDDERGRAALDELRLRGIDLRCVEIDPDHATGVVDVELQKGAPVYRIHPDAAWDFIQPTHSLESILPSLDALYFGTLAQRSPESRRTLRSLDDSVGPGCLRIFDINLRTPWWSPATLEWGCSVAMLLKMSLEEVPQLAEALSLDANPQNPLEVARVLLERYPIRLAAVTRGAHGSLFVTRERVLDIAGIPARVVDTVGAGDAFTAGLTLSLLRGESIECAAETANRWGAEAVARPGGMPPCCPSRDSAHGV